MTDIELLITILLMATGTIITRFLAFWIFPDNKETSPYIVYLGKVLPYAVIGFLIVYCLKSTEVMNYPFGLPEALSIIFVILLHVWKRNIFLSIGLGTAIYMVLLQRVFI
jgi:Predicted branched-chain amino acid permeases (azaleucine resistance)